MRVLVTGGAGFIGTALVRRLTASGHSVRVLDSLSPQVHGTDPAARLAELRRAHPGVEFIVGSVGERGDWERAIEGQEGIVHLAAETGTGQSMYESERYVRVNVAGTALMLDVLGSAAHQVRKVVVASSRAVTGEGKYRRSSGEIVYPGSRSAADMAAGRFELCGGPGGEPLQPLGTDEATPFSPVSVYGITKQAQEQLVVTGCAALGVPSVALRYQNVYGPGQSLSNPYTGILSIFATRMLAGRDIEIFEDGHESRDFLFVDDAVDVTLAALLRHEADGAVLSIGSGQRISVLEATQALERTLDTPATVRVTGRFRAGDIRHNFADISRARALLGFAPAVSFEEGLRRFVAWVRAVPERRDGYERSLAELTERGLLRGGDGDAR